SGKVKRLLKNSSLLSNINLPFVTGTSLNHLFPHRLLPHEVWIGPEGKVSAITGHQEVQSTNIHKFLSSSASMLRTKYDIIDYDARKPLMAGGLGSYEIPAENIRYSRMITSFIPGLASFISDVNKHNNPVT